MPYLSRRLLAAISVLCTALPLQAAQDPPEDLKKLVLEQNGFTELGRVTWHRSPEPAKAEAKRTGKPRLVFSTELPG